MSDVKEKKPVQPGYVFAMLLAVGIGLIVLAMGIDQVGQVINRNTRALLVALIVAGFATMMFSGKKSDEHHHPAPDKDKK